MAPDTAGEERTIRARATRLLANAKYRAQRKQIEFDLDREWVLQRLRAGKCEFTGLPFSYDPPHAGRKRNGFAPSIHRRDSSGPYTKSNCMLIATAANVAIAELTTNEFLLLALAALRRHDLA